jgi:predicted dehydrogenase
MSGGAESGGMRIGFVGLGGIARQRHMPGLRRIEGVRVVAVANRSRASSERAAAEFGIPHVCDTWQDVVARDDIHAVFIGTWPYMHREVAIAALETGKHVFCQARMAMDAAEARDMADKARETGLVAMVCPVPIGMSTDTLIARLLHEDFIGDLRLVRVQSFSNAYARADAPMNWRKDHRLSGLNMHTLGMYIEVIHRWFGWTASVSAAMDIFVPERVDDRGERVAVKIPDQILVHSRLKNRVLVEYTISAAVHHGRDTIEIYGSDGTLFYDVATDTLHGARHDETVHPIDRRPEETVDLENWPVERDFIRAIRDGAAYHPTFEDGLRYMEVVQAVYVSAGQQRVVTLQE